MFIESAGMTHIGKRRKENQDALLIDDTLGLYVVADGVGGHQAGEVASQMAVEIICQNMNGSFDHGINGEEAAQDPTLSQAANHLMSSIHLANHEVHKSANSNKDYHGMGSTVSAVYVTDKTLVAANVGDSPIYLVRQGIIDLLSVPHTMQNEQAVVDSEGNKSLGSSFKHILTRAIGARKIVKADIFELQYFEGDTIVICSDGLSDKLSPDEILEVVTNEQPDTACRMLIDRANERGGDDNVTVIVLILNKNNSIKGKVFKFFRGLGKQKLVIKK